MWLDGDPTLLAYFFLNIFSGVMCILLLISFGATKHILRCSVYTLFSLSGALTTIPRRTPGGYFPCSTPGNALTHPFSSIGIRDCFLGNRGFSRFHPSVSLRRIDPLHVHYLAQSSGTLQTMSLAPHRISRPALLALLYTPPDRSCKLISSILQRR